MEHTVYLRNDGSAIAVGKQDARCDVPDLDGIGLQYIGVAAAGFGTLLLRSDGSVITKMVQIAAPFAQNLDAADHEPPPGKRYVAGALRGSFMVLLRDDGEAVAVGPAQVPHTELGAVPELPTGCRYTSVYAGAEHVVLTRSDGEAVAFGKNDNGRCSVPPLPEGLSWVPSFQSPGQVAVRIVTVRTQQTEGGGQSLVCFSMNGDVLAELPARNSRPVWEMTLGEVHKAIQSGLQPEGCNRRLSLVTAEGRQLCGHPDLTLLESLEGRQARLGKTWEVVNGQVWHHVVSSAPIQATATNEGEEELGGKPAVAKAVEEDLLRVLTRHGVRRVPEGAVADLVRWKLGGELRPREDLLG